MGCIISSNSLSLPPEGTYYNSSDVAQFGLLGLDEDDLRDFSAIFYSFDPLADCNISLQEFMPSLRLETNFVTSAIFDMMDSARDKQLSFGEVKTCIYLHLLPELCLMRYVHIVC
jgi:hypothetical protein